MDSSSVHVEAFARTGLSQDQWQAHFKHIIPPLLSQCIPSAQFAASGELKILKTTNDGLTLAAVQTFQTSRPLSLLECGSVAKSAACSEIESRTNIEHVILPASLGVYHADSPGLAVFDMDSTLIQQEVIDELARAVGLYDKVAAITEAAMRGEAPYTDFEASLRARVALLHGVPMSIWNQLKSSTITFTPGAKELVRSLKALGWKTAVLSGGFIPLASWVKDTLGLDYAYANHLVTDDKQGILTGELVEGKPIIHAEKKRELLKHIAEEENIPLERTIAVGDGSNDLLMMGVAGLGIAFHAKPKVQAAAPVRLNSETLLDVMHILGYTQEEVKTLLHRS